MRRRHLLHGALLALLPLALGCDEPLIDLSRTNGNSDKGFFLIEPKENVAVGARLDVAVMDFEGNSTPVPGQPRDVSSSDEAAVAFKGVENGRLTFEGLAPGEASVGFEGTADKEAIRDSFTMKAIAPARMKLKTERCLGGVYLRGAPAFIDFHFEGDGGNAQGYGFYPLTVTGLATVNTAHRDPFTVRVDVASDAGDTIHLRSTLPDDPSEATLPLVDASAITSVEPVRDGNNAPMRPGETDHLRLRVMAGNREVCSPIEAEIREETPKTCKATGSTFDPFFVGMLARGGGAAAAPVAFLGLGASVAIEVLREGTCKLSVVLLLATGAEVAKTLVFESKVERPPSPDFDD